MGGSPTTEFGIHPLVRSAAQIAQLREFCALWQGDGPGGFWGFDSVLEAAARPGFFGIIAAPACDAPWLGVLLCEAGHYSADLLYIFVRPEARKLGVGQALLGHLIEDLERREGMEALFLEVRPDNLIARKLYEDNGLAEVGRRKNYYGGKDDALLMRRNFPSRVGQRGGT